MGFVDAVKDFVGFGDVDYEEEYEYDYGELMYSYKYNTLNHFSDVFKISKEERTKKIVKRSELNAMGITDPADIKKVMKQMAGQFQKSEVKKVEKLFKMTKCILAMIIHRKYFVRFFIIIHIDFLTNFITIISSCTKETTLIISTRIYVFN